MVRILLTACLLLAYSTGTLFLIVFDTRFAFTVGFIVGGVISVGLAPVLLGLIVNGV